MIPSLHLKRATERFNVDAKGVRYYSAEVTEAMVTLKKAPTRRITIDLVDDKYLVDIPTAADLLGVKTTSIYEAMKSGTLGYVKVVKHRKILLSQLKDYVERMTVAPAPLRIEDPWAK